MGKTIRSFGNDGLKRMKQVKAPKHRPRFDAYIDDDDDYDESKSYTTQNSDDSDNSGNG